MPRSASPTRNAGWASIASGVIGILAFASLITYLVTQAGEFGRSGVMPPVGRLLLGVDFVGAALQVLLMLPVSMKLHELGRGRPSQASLVALVVGITGFLAVAIARTLTLFIPAFSDILFMAPMGLVGVWLIAVNWLREGMPSRGLTVVGVIAGVGLTLVGLNFFFNGGIAVFTHGPFAYATDIRFHMGLALGGVPGFILFPVWAIWIGIKLLRPQYS